ncbi:MAG TPA: hypothetical protein VI172_03775 [Candidatus Dormibacteraeota bacterium]|jgi:hypothetical protein
MRRRLFIAALSLVPSLFGSPAHAGWSLCGKDDKHEIDLTQSFDDETLRGPTTIVLRNVNQLRYRIKVGSTITVTAGPDLSAGLFIPSLPTAAAAPTPAATPATASTAADQAPERARLSRVQGAFEALNTELAKVAKVIADLRQLASDAQDQVAGGVGRVLDLVGRSDQVLAGKGEDELAAEVVVVRNGLTQALNARWPPADDIRNARARLSAVAGQLRELPLREPGFSAWAQVANNRDDFRATLDLAAQLDKVLSALEPGSDKRKEFDAQVGKLAGWDSLLAQLTKPESFKKTINADCGHLFDSNRSTVYKLTRVDRLEADPTKSKEELVLATVECPSSFSISAGVGVSGINETDIDLVSAPGDATHPTVNKIVYKDRGSEQVNPTFLTQTRLTDWQRCNVHATAGTVIDVDNPSSKVAIGYLLGLSLSIRDKFYLTGGVQVGRVARLIDGVHSGDIAPEGLAEPPTERHWTGSWVVAASFKIR